LLFPTLGSSSLPVVVAQAAQPDERHANRTASVLEWYVRHRAYSNEEEDLETQQANLPVCSSDYPFNAERQAGKL